MTNYNAIWNRENNQGNGFAVGDESDDINEIAGLGDLIERAHSDNDVAVYRDGNATTTIVGNANGPWAVRA
jgi:hypothetical protein